MSKQIFIFGANHYNGNRGVGALLISALHFLEKTAKEVGEEFEYTIVNTAFKRDTDEIDIGNSIVKIKNQRPFEITNVKSFVKAIKSSYNRKLLKAFKNADYFFNIGEGDSFSDIYGEKRFDFINNQTRLAQFLGVKTCLLPQTIGPFKSPEIRKKALKSISKCQLVLPRDKKSLDYIKENAPHENCFEITDMAFFMPFKAKSFEPEKTHVGINVSGLMWAGGYTKNNQFGLKTDYKEIITSVINHFLAMENVVVHVVPHVVLQNEDVENDYMVGLELLETYKGKNLVLAPFFLSALQAKNYIAGLDFFTGARMHACIAAFSSRTAVIPMAYSRKFNGLFGDTLDYPHLGDMVNEETSVVLNAIVKGFENRRELAEKIDQRMSNIVEERGKLLQHNLIKFLTA